MNAISPLLKNKARKGLLCKFSIVLKFLAATKSISTGALELSRKARDEFFARRIPDTLLCPSS